MQRSLRIQHWMGWLAAAMVAVWTSLAMAAVPVVVLPITGVIGPASAAYVICGLQQACNRGAQLIVLQTDTPGDLDMSMRQIIQAILASPVPVAGYVVPGGAWVASAGTYTFYACHVAVMVPAMNLGAAPPVTIGMGGHAPSPGNDAKPASVPSASSSNEDTFARKQMHDAAAHIRGLAQLHGRNAEWAERAVCEVVGLDATEAVSQYVVDLVAVSLPDLLKQVDGRAVRTSADDAAPCTTEATIVTLEPDWRNHLLSVITDPSLALLLLTVGVYALTPESSTSGMVVPGILGAVYIVVALYGLQMLPVNYAGFALIALGLGCMVTEAFLPTFGALSVGGIVTFMSGAVMLIDMRTPGFGVSFPFIIGLALVSLIVVLVLSSLAVRARQWPIVTGGDTLIGMTGEVVDVGTPDTDADSDGRVCTHGECWCVRCDGDITRSDQVRVIARCGLILMVEPVALFAASS